MMPLKLIAALLGNAARSLSSTRASACATGEWLRRAQRRRGDARVQLRVAAEIFDHPDARPGAERARTELRASGETAVAAGRGGGQLTPLGLQIAMLVTAGTANAEIGRSVFLSRPRRLGGCDIARRPDTAAAERTSVTRRASAPGAPCRLGACAVEEPPALG